MFTRDQISIRITPCPDQEACLCNVLNITSTVSSLVECSSAMVYDCSLLINVSDQHICISPGLVPRPRPLPPHVSITCSTVHACNRMLSGGQKIRLYMYMKITTHVPYLPLYTTSPPPPPNTHRKCNVKLPTPPTWRQKDH